MLTPPAALERTASWPAMGTRATVLVVGAGASGAVEHVRALGADLEARWSRFIPTSEVSRLNGAGGVALHVRPDTAALIADAVEWWHATGGRFDPTVLAAVIDAGYSRSFDAGPGPVGPGAPVPGCAGIDVDWPNARVRLPAGVGIDLGGIGKGRAVDLAVAALQHTAGGLVDLGGDLRVWGVPPDGLGGWPIAVADLRDGSTAAVLGLRAGAVATSTVLRRRWRAGPRTAHHLIDPATGRPVDGPIVSVTVAAAEAAGAEVLAKAALVAGSVASATELLDDHGVAGLLVSSSGPPIATGGFDDLCWERAWSP